MPRFLCLSVSVRLTPNACRNKKRTGRDMVHGLGRLERDGVPMSGHGGNVAITRLRDEIHRLEGEGKRCHGSLPFGIPDMDRRLPGGGLMIGALHEVAGGSNGAVDGAAASLFVAGIAGRTKGPVLWCMTNNDLFPPALAQAGLSSDRLILVEAPDEQTLLGCFEEGLRHGGLGAVVAEVARLSMTASRRLHLAAERSGSVGIALRRWRRQADASDYGHPTASLTRWRVSGLPSSPLPVPGVDRHRWLVELIRCKAGESADFEVEACDGSGCLALPTQVVDRQISAFRGWRAGAG